jgi:hypothetical protein
VGKRESRCDEHAKSLCCVSAARVCSPNAGCTSGCRAPLLVRARGAAWPILSKLRDYSSLSRELDQFTEKASQYDDLLWAGDPGVDLYDDRGRRLLLAFLLNAIGTFLTKAGHRRPGDELTELSSALLDLNDGAVKSIFKPPAGIARREPTHIWIDRADVASAVEALHAAGMSLKDASQLILRTYKSIEKLGQKVKWQTLVNWRKEFSAGRVKNEVANEVFIGNRKVVRVLEGDTLWWVAESWVQRASGYYFDEPIAPRALETMLAAYKQTGAADKAMAVQALLRSFTV